MATWIAVLRIAYAHAISSCHRLIPNRNQFSPAGTSGVEGFLTGLGWRAVPGFLGAFTNPGSSQHLPHDEMSNV